MKTALIGTKQLGLDALDVLHAQSEVTSIITMDDRSDARSRFPAYIAHGAAVTSTRADAERAIREIDADFALVAGWYWLISTDALRTCKFFGIHHSLLPAYRGGSPLVWALIEGAQIVGTSLFELSDRADAGPVWGQAKVEAGDGYIGHVSRRCDAAAVALIGNLFDPDARPVLQDESSASWRSQRHPDNGLINWSRPAIDVQRWIRAQSHPYPGAFTFIDDTKATIWKASISAQGSTAAPGTVSRGVVACGDGIGLLVEESTIDIPDGVVLGSPTPDIRDARSGA